MAKILSFDIGLINLSYCILTKKNFNQDTNWEILEWTNIDLTNRSNEICCVCNKKACLSNIIDNITNYYCKTHAKNINIVEDEFINYFSKCDVKDKICNYSKNTKCCDKKGIYNKNDNYYCGVHAKLIHKNNNKNKEIKGFKKAGLTTVNFDDIKYIIESVYNKYITKYIIQYKNLMDN